MIKIFTSPSCSSCRKVKKWFDEQQIPYTVKNIFSPSLTSDDIMEIIQKSENGTDAFISKRSKIVLEKHIDFDSMTISELVAFILANPSVLKRPIIVDDRRIQVGYNEDEITTFIPIARRLAELFCSSECEKWGSCDYSKNLVENNKKGA